jgi:RHS repeat-associated protein
LQLGNSRWENTTFNSRLQPTQLGLGTSSTDQSLWKVNYDYGTTDNNGNVKSQTITVPSLTAMVQTYTYDSLNRIKSATETVSNAITWKQTFTYDRFGNRNFDTANTTTLGSCSTAQCNPTIDIANNRFTTGQGYTFDLSGNLLTDAQGRTFTYDAENKQKEIKDSGNNSVGQYFYDGNGARIKKVSATETTLFVYDASAKLVGEYLLTSATPTSPTTSYLTNDTLGSPRVVTDASGNILSRRDFMPFGEEITRTNYGTDSVRQKFTGYERDGEANLDYAQARYYNSFQGRFNSPDAPFSEQIEEKPQSWNLYFYTENNPLKYIDPLGRWKQVACSGGATLCYESDSADDTYESLADLLGYAAPKNLKEFFGSQEISIGKVFDLSGYEDWRNQGFKRDMISGSVTERRITDMEFVFGEGIKPERVIIRGLWGWIKNLFKGKTKSPSGASNIIQYQNFKRLLRSLMSKPPVTDPDLQKIMSDLYRANATIGSGSTAAAVRQEIATGQPVGGVFHTQKAQDYIIALERWIKNNPLANASDRHAAEQVILDLKDALGR